MISKKIKAYKIISLVFLLIFAMSVVLAGLQIRSGAGIGIGTWFPPLYFLILLCVTYNVYNLKKILKKAYKPLIYIFYCGMSAFCIAFMSLCVYITNYSPPALPDNPDLVIVLGARTIGYQPATVLRYRLDFAAVILDKYPDALCIVAGGQGPDAIQSEAHIMRQYLINKNIDEARIIKEDRSSDTFQNLIFSREIIEQKNLNSASIIIVTSEFHIPRAIMIAERVFDNAQIYAVQAETPFMLFSAGITREFFAFVKSFIFDREN